MCNPTKKHRFTPFLVLASFLLLGMASDLVKIPYSQLPEEEQAWIDTQYAQLDEAEYLIRAMEKFGYDPLAEEHLVSEESFMAKKGQDEDISEVAGKSAGLYTNLVEDNAALDVEGVVTVVNIPDQGQTKPHSTVAFIRRPPSEPPYIRTATAIQDAGYFIYNDIGPEYSFDSAVDPILEANTFDYGVAPKRVYLASLNIGDTYGASHRAILVHTSDSGGLSWNNPTYVALEDDFGTETLWLIDKPEMAVSRYFFKAGRVYVVYQRLLQGGDPDVNQLYITRSLDGGASFETPVQLPINDFDEAGQSNSDDVLAPQVVVNPDNGRVYVLWMDQDSEAIRMIYSDHCCVASSWSGPETVAEGFFVTNHLRYLDGPQQTQGITIPQARYDDFNNRLVVVWHEADREITSGTHTGRLKTTTLEDNQADFIADGVQVNDFVFNWTRNSTFAVTNILSSTRLKLSSLGFLDAGGQPNFYPGNQYTIRSRDTDIFYTARTASGWLNKVRIQLNNRQGVQFQPSFDFDNGGGTMIGFYDRSGASGAFQPHWVKVNTNGGKIAEGTFPNAPSIVPGKWMGDYTDTLFWPYTDVWGPRFHFIFAGQTGYMGNVNIYGGAVD